MTWIIQLIVALFTSTPAAPPPLSRDQKYDANYKTTRCEGEFYALRSAQPYLYEAGIDVCEFCITQFGIRPVITDVMRTQAEQDYIYRNNPKYIKADGTKRVSPHQLGHAVDFRSIDPNTQKAIYSAQQLAQLGEHINSKWNPSNTYGYTIEHHVVPDGVPHIHLQYLRKP